jgi:hypothetical protein
VREKVWCGRLPSGARCLDAREESWYDIPPSGMPSHDMRGRACAADLLVACLTIARGKRAGAADLLVVNVMTRGMSEPLICISGLPVNSLL